MRHTEANSKDPLVSVIITCYNQGHFLAEAIASALKQTYKPLDIIVVDDGSTDDTKAVALTFPGVRYIFQNNAGLSSARNTGIENSRGEYLLFLDADDWLYDDAIRTNVDFLLKNPSCAFVSGAHNKVDEWNYDLPTEEQVVVTDNHYLNLLRGNYIGMHAAVLYQYWVFSRFRFDTSLKACEDYDLYLNITRDHPVVCHGQKIAAYRIHGNNMSSKIPFMLEHVLLVSNRQQTKLRGEEEKEAFKKGQEIWREYYTEKLYKLLMYHPDKKNQFPSYGEAGMLIRNKPFGFVKLSLKKTREALKTNLKEKLPDVVLKNLHRAGAFKEYTPKSGSVSPGDFERVTPFSYDFGFDRGGAIDRFYIQQFLEANAGYVKGTVLEIGDNEYTLLYGGDKVTKSEILHIDSSNAKATYIGDITDVPQIPSEHFDCIIFTQTLHLIYDFKRALATCRRILKPGGCLLLTVPGISHIDHGDWKDYWLWSFTDKSIRKILGESFPERNVDIKTFGNVYVAAAFLYGMGLPEFKKEFLNHQDPSYQVIISAKTIKM